MNNQYHNSIELAPGSLKRARGEGSSGVFKRVRGEGSSGAIKNASIQYLYVMSANHRYPTRKPISHSFPDTIHHANRSIIIGGYSVWLYNNFVEGLG